ncbi:hypothetical protein ACJJTC_001403 [Scirpophaga incertulas]
MNSLKVDSGVESEENSGYQSDEDSVKNKVIEILSTKLESPNTSQNSSDDQSTRFFDSKLSYILPAYTHNVLDDVVAFTFHVKNTEPDSVKVEKVDSNVYIKFTSIGSGFVPVHYAAIIKFVEEIKFNNVTGEAWDNNVILQLELLGDAPQKFQIGLNEDKMVNEEFDMSHVTENIKGIGESPKSNSDAILSVVEVTNSGNETNIVVSSNTNDDESALGEKSTESSTIKHKEIVWANVENSESGAKSILRKPMIRSFSESSTVRFNKVIARQFYRYNSSIEGQKKKNQRKKSKKRVQERRKSESEAEDEVTNSMKTSKTKLKSALKQRRDSGLADTSDAEATEERQTTPEAESYDSSHDISQNSKVLTKPTNWKSDEYNDEVFEQNKKTGLISGDTIKHNTDFYNPDKLNKGKYLEVSFKNDLIFDLDM